MGQSVLRDGRVPFQGTGDGLHCPQWIERKGGSDPRIRSGGDGHQGVQCNNATNPREAGGSPREKGRAPWNGLAPREGPDPGSVTVPVASGELSLALENLGERV
ncbi:hypothetical protein VULLAG_LOCUS246 [Vulpes lagopus]